MAWQEVLENLDYPNALYNITALVILVCSLSGYTPSMLFSRWDFANLIFRHHLLHWYFYLTCYKLPYSLWTLSTWELLQMTWHFWKLHLWSWMLLHSRKPTWWPKVGQNLLCGFWAWACVAVLFLGVKALMWFQSLLHLAVYFLNTCRNLNILEASITVKVTWTWLTDSKVLDGAGNVLTCMWSM